MPDALHRPLQAIDLLPRGPLRRLGRQVFLFERTASTNSFLLQSEQAGDGAIAWAESQDAGRGRLGRTWHAPRGSSILLSVRLQGSDAAAAWPNLRQAGLISAVAVVEAIEAETDCHALVRWPNDITIGGRKVGGVLAEARGLEGGGRVAVIGMGINCLQQAGHFPAELQGKATSLELESRGVVDRSRLAARLVERLDAYFSSGESQPGQWLTRWREHCADLGTRTRLRRDGRDFSGTIVDVDPSGDLLLQSDDGARMRFESATTTRIWD
jgi:BirA family biotin operon repressor/biotin-[acetyl-CoA-carboxylase] ligase